MKKGEEEARKKESQSVREVNKSMVSLKSLYQ
jgi:hypothetical protein